MSGAQDGFSHPEKRAFLPVCCQPICLASGFQIVVQNVDDQLAGSHVFLDGLDSPWFQNDRGTPMVLARIFSSLGSLHLFHFMSPQ